MRKETGRNKKINELIINEINLRIYLFIFICTKIKNFVVFRENMKYYNGQRYRRELSMLTRKKYIAIFNFFFCFTVKKTVINHFFLDIIRFNYFILFFMCGAFFFVWMKILVIRIIKQFWHVNVFSLKAKFATLKSDFSLLIKSYSLYII